MTTSDTPTPAQSRNARALLRAFGSGDRFRRHLGRVRSRTHTKRGPGRMPVNKGNPVLTVTRNPNPELLNLKLPG